MIPEANVQELQSSLDGDVQAVYDSHLKSGDIQKIKNLKNLTGVKPDFGKEELQELYVRKIAECDYEFIHSMKELSGVNVEFLSVFKNIGKIIGNLDAAAHKAYKQIFREIEDVKYEYEDERNKKREKARALKRAIGAGPSMITAQLTHKFFFSNCMPDDVKLVKELSGFEPDYGACDMKCAVQECYGGIFGYGNIDDARKLKESSGIEPTKEAVHKGYEKLLIWARVPEIKEVIKYTGVEIDYDIRMGYGQSTIKNAVQRGFDIAFDFGDAKRAEDLKEFTGLMPDYENASITHSIQRGYEMLFIACDTDEKKMEEIKKLKEFTGIAPSEALLKKYNITEEALK